MDYLKEFGATARALHPYPLNLRPILRPFLVPESRMIRIMMRAARILEPAIIERLASPGAHPDLLQFLVDSSPDGINKMMPIVLKVLVFAAAVVSSH